MAAAPPTVEDLSAELMVLVARLGRAVTRQIGGTAAEVPTASLRLLSQVEELEPVTVGDLATADRCSQPTMSAGVATLVGRGWATKGPNPRDARSTLVRLTDAGRLVLADTRRRRADVVAERLRLDALHDEHDLAVAVAVLRGLLGPEAHPIVPPTPTGTTTEGSA
jgi:DNA-binding MarR family transcriptional regulator